MDVRGIVVCVDYDDLLRITLPRNLRFLREVLVVTSPGDARTRDIVNATPGARLHVTDAFYRHGAQFNKGAAMEEGFDALGREGWIWVWDADILLPEDWTWPDADPSCLYGTRRHMLPIVEPHLLPHDWKQCFLQPDITINGYFQLFHAAAEHVAAVRPWYGLGWGHAAQSDIEFSALYPKDKQVWLPEPVRHLGPADQNWAGRVVPRLDSQPIPHSMQRWEYMLRFWHMRLTLKEVGDFERIKIPQEPK